MKYVIAILAGLSLAACAGLGKPQPEIASYDFGLTPPISATSWPVRLGLADVKAAAGLEGKALRYRLEYREPARVYAYSLSKWSAQPSELLTRRLRQFAGSHVAGSNCSLQVVLEAFDHVYQSADASYGLVRLQATITDSKHHTTIAGKTFTHTSPAQASNAQGGVAALSAAADAAMQDIVGWVATVSVEEKFRACAD